MIRGSKKSNIGNRGDELRGAQVIRSYSMLQLLSHPHPLPSLLLPRLHPPCSCVLLFLHSRQCLAPNTSASLRCLLLLPGYYHLQSRQSATVVTAYYYPFIQTIHFNVEKVWPYNFCVPGDCLFFSFYAYDTLQYRALLSSA